MTTAQVGTGATDPPGTTQKSTSWTSTPAGTGTSSMSVTPARVSAGSQIEVYYEGPIAADRGGYFYLEDAAGKQIAGLWSDRGESGDPGFTTDLDEFEILDYAVSGRGPDTLLTPPDLKAGQYRLCTANSVPETCAAVVLS